MHQIGDPGLASQSAAAYFGSMTELESQATPQAKTFNSFEEFYPFYLSQHSKPLTRYIHVAGTGLALTNLAKSLMFGPRKQAVLTPVIGYGFAWFAHFVVEGNKPATFGYPAYSFRGDLTMMYDIVRGRDNALQQLADNYKASLEADETVDEDTPHNPTQVPEPELADSPDSSTSSIDAA